jgi:hypothetical protein
MATSASPPLALSPDCDPAPISVGDYRIRFAVGALSSGEFARATVAAVRASWCVGH